MKKVILAVMLMLFIAPIFCAAQSIDLGVNDEAKKLDPNSFAYQHPRLQTLFDDFGKYAPIAELKKDIVEMWKNDPKFSLKNLNIYWDADGNMWDYRNVTINLWYTYKGKTDKKQYIFDKTIGLGTATGLTNDIYLVQQTYPIRPGGLDYYKQEIRKIIEDETKYLFPETNKDFWINQKGVYHDIYSLSIYQRFPFFLDKKMKPTSIMDLIILIKQANGENQYIHFDFQTKEYSLIEMQEKDLEKNHILLKSEKMIKDLPHDYLYYDM